jgi:hypothetical protein
MDGEDPLLEGMAAAAAAAASKAAYGMTLDHYMSRMVTTPASAAATSGERGRGRQGIKAVPYISIDTNSSISEEASSAFSSLYLQILES